MVTLLKTKTAKIDALFETKTATNNALWGHTTRALSASIGKEVTLKRNWRTSHKKPGCQNMHCGVTSKLYYRCTSHQIRAMKNNERMTDPTIRISSLTVKEISL